MRKYSKERPPVTMLIAFLLMVIGSVAVNASVVPMKLQCEYRINPLDIDVKQPQLMWQVQSGERDQKQTAYQILVASSLEFLKKDQGNLWDTGKVFSGETVSIVYAGKPLSSGVQCFWKVRVWDKNGKMSAWSAPALWSMGLMEQSDWEGKWIGWDHGEKTNDLSGARWIWFPEGDPAVSAPVATRYFRQAFDLPNNQTVQAATIEIVADDRFHLFVNGREAGEGDGWGSPKKIDIRAWLKSGKNVLAVEASNAGNSPNPAGLVAKLKVTLSEGLPVTLITDDGWKTASNSETDWNTLTFDDGAWVNAKALGEYGTLTWGTIQGNDRRLPARYLRCDFTVEKKVRRATAYVCGLGLFEFYLNGNKVGNNVLSPALSEYNKRAFYVSFDVSEQLKRGDNAVGVILGNGRYFAPSPPSGMATFGYPKLKLQMNIEYTDGTMAQVVSDETWRLTTEGPIQANNEYNGEEYDARLEMPDWSLPKFDDSKWQRVELVKPGAPVLSAQIGEPMRVVETIHPVTITNPKPGIYIFDMGQNMAGWCRLKVSGPEGTAVKLRHAELLKPDGTLFTANLRTAKAEDIYTLKGNGVEIYEPRFTHHGFQYVEVTGFPGKPDLDAIEGEEVHDALPRAGEFKTSNALINKIYQNIYWTTRDNLPKHPHGFAARRTSGLDGGSTGGFQGGNVFI